MKKTKNFTLIELLVVIGIIGILATIVIPAVGNALADAKRTSAQAGCKSYEESMYQSDTKYNNVIKNGMKNLMKIADGVKLQKYMMRVVSGRAGVKNDGSFEYNPGSTEEGTWGEWEVQLDDTGKYYESLIDPGFFELTDEGKVQYFVDGGLPAIVENKFGIRYQITYRKPDDNGTVEVYSPTDSNVIIDIKGIKRFASPVRVVSWDDEEPAKFITRDGAFRLYSDKTCKTPITQADWEGGITEAFIDNK